MKQTKEQKAVYEKLAEIPDPELNVSITDLGLIYGVKTDTKKGTVVVTMTLTTIGCPLFGVIEKTVEQKVKELPWVKKVSVELTFDPPWSMEMMTDGAKVELGIL
ncbi:MAG: FtsQ-type POTRA domain-containing protein [Patescibacteria group bacterium]